ncbi:MAG: hypothetical protein DHS20C21_06940 [Gemmatimonadota bacterium]|nr:MAG: hypothetical protein DHS20C21_06940 [Gemmatimonadota bacterium]
MPDCFISYTSKDRKLATFVFNTLKANGLDPFLAAVSIRAGADWSGEIRDAMQSTRWVIFLASKAACKSDFVQQEVGAAYFGGKTVVPVVWDMSPSDLPGWTKRAQALDFRGATRSQIAGRIQGLAKEIRGSRGSGLLIAAAIIGGLVWLAGRSDS